MTRVRRTSEVLARMVATCAGLGDRLPAPGTTAGSLPATALWLALALGLHSPIACTLATAAAALLATIAGLWAAAAESTRRGLTDPGPVVIDEVAGQLLCFAVARPWLDPGSPDKLVLATAIGFVLFRALDVVKPWPIDRLERLPGGLGIMADDLAAGLVAGLLLAATASLL